VISVVADRWKSAVQSVIRPPAPPEVDEAQMAESILRGRKLYYGPTANCFSCHGDSAQGDGQIYTLNAGTGSAGTEASGQQPGVVIRDAINLSLPSQTLRPRNLRQGVYRGGRRPLDLYRRISAGIDGSPMPGLGATPGVKPEDIWDIVHYVMSLPYESVSIDAPQVENRSKVQ
jgi:mono/diheme cytochrome c family protein